MPDETDASWEEQALLERGGEFDDETFLRVLKETTSILNEEGIEYLLMGGLASSSVGRLRWTHDIDFLVSPEGAVLALDALELRGFMTQRTYPDWLFKAMRDGVLIDLIFKSSGDIYLDSEMLKRGSVREFQGHPVRSMSAEDLVVIKAIASQEPTSRHWYDALAIIAAIDLDWDYLLTRARAGARRVLSLLVFAQSNDLVVPNPAIERLFRMIYSGD